MSLVTQTGGTGIESPPVRIVKADELQLLTCLQHELWGGSRNRFARWKLGDCIVFVVDFALAGMAEVVGEPFLADDPVWKNGLFPYRIPIRFVHLIFPENRPKFSEGIQQALVSAWGKRYGFSFLLQTIQPQPVRDTVVDAIHSRPSELHKIQLNLEMYLKDAKVERDRRIALRPRRKLLGRKV